MIVLQIIPWVDFLPVPAAKPQLQPHLHKWVNVNSELKHECVSGAQWTASWLNLQGHLWQNYCDVCKVCQRFDCMGRDGSFVCAIFLVSSLRRNLILTFQNQRNERSCLGYLSAVHMYVNVWMCGLIHVCRRYVPLVANGSLVCADW